MRKSRVLHKKTQKYMKSCSYTFEIFKISTNDQKQIICFLSCIYDNDKYKFKVVLYNGQN